MVNVGALITLVIFILILTALAPSIITNTYTGTCLDLGEAANKSVCGLENASAGSKSMFGLAELLYPVLGIFGVLAVIGIGKAKR